MITKNIIRFFFALSVSVGLLAVSAQRAEAFGNPDLSFGSMGTKTDFGLDFEPTAMTRQADGKIVAVGRRYESGIYELVVRRYLADGTFDGSYSLSNQTIMDIEILPDSRILTLGIKAINGKAYAELTQKLP